MADRIFAGALLLVVIGYGIIAFVAIKAPFQYDPLGPESWPRILAVVAVLCLLPILARPDVSRLATTAPTWARLAAMLVLLVIYAEIFQRTGFVIATFAFCLVVARMLGAPLWRSAAFGLAIGVLGYLLCAGLLGLNLPAGLLPKV